MLRPRDRHRLERSIRGLKRFLGSLALIVFLAVSIAEDSPGTAMLKARRAQELMDELRAALSIDSQVRIAAVRQHPFVFAVEPIDGGRQRFLLSLELAFLLMLDEDELRAALAHELGHVWIFTHHPFLQTERLANEIGQRVVGRDSFEKLYSKLWAYEGTPGVGMNQLLGPQSGATPRVVSEPQSDITGDTP
jgi:hypothetical protein